MWAVFISSSLFSAHFCSMQQIFWAVVHGDATQNPDSRPVCGRGIVVMISGPVWLHVLLLSILAVVKLARHRRSYSAVIAAPLSRHRRLHQAPFRNIVKCTWARRCGPPACLWLNSSGHEGCRINTSPSLTIITNLCVIYKLLISAPAGNGYFLLPHGSSLKVDSLSDRIPIKLVTATWTAVGFSSFIYLSYLFCNAISIFNHGIALVLVSRDLR